MAGMTPQELADLAAHYKFCKKVCDRLGFPLKEDGRTIYTPPKNTDELIAEQDAIAKAEKSAGALPY